MLEKKFSGAPFGSQVPRFDVSSVHPRIKFPGTYTQYPYENRCLDEIMRAHGPGMYFRDDRCLSSKPKASSPGWARAYEVEQMAKVPHLLYKDQWEAKKMLVRKMGPGIYEVPDFLQTGNLMSTSNRGVCEPLAERFTDQLRSRCPGPGTYGKGGIPDTVLREKEKESTSTLGMMEAPPAKTPTGQGKFPGPGTYNSKSFTDVFTSPESGLSPMERYSYDRNKPLIVGHYATLKTENLGPGQYEIKSTIDDWHHQYKKKHGRFGKICRFPSRYTDRHTLASVGHYPKEKHLPGPGSYHPVDDIEYYIPPKVPAFLTSSVQRRGYLRSNVPGVGRYDMLRFEDSQHTNGHTNTFRSKSLMRPSMLEDSITRDRLKATSVPKEYRELYVPQDFDRTKEVIVRRPITAM